MRNKNIFKLFFASMLFVMACKAYVEEKKEIDSLMEDVLALVNDSSGGKFKDYKDKINELKENLKDIGNAELKEKLLNLQNSFQDKLAAKLAALKAAKNTIENITDKDQDISKRKIWSEAKLVGVTVPLLGSNTSGNGDKMSKNAVEQIDKVIKFLEEGTN
ncbi:fibronectin-binding protein RevA [Borreliella burgdorferi]|uniref:Rev protein n=1 Tax=Borreliella burgdorferi (strain ATCC 35210 / DSM 4680 / CIP 102532 / B31) TaxID=224326 RepID=Q9S0B8_BORBU|nr:fibronectin-binding protein RevA [Borreliella burgdorferi]AAF07538.1 rev protein [Borreliella burgdorferi B31]MCD2309489.1 fibronectin-binding protein RevA [Borreliella burgdorferi]MCD2318745.1 fibronectin-binding protein RevA [Borreliella burgdorferi]MCD2381656.1 fibronectin-binding protein RevA [Borreliella burgdorferi]MCR8876512.1 fibronectin-binding protein RevA [Borreliella burgdorferi]